MATSREQQLVDYCFEFALKSAQYMQNRSRDDIAAWVRHNLKECGFPTIAAGMSWGVLDHPALKQEVEKNSDWEIVEAGRPE